METSPDVEPFLGPALPLDVVHCSTSSTWLIRDTELQRPMILHQTAFRSNVGQLISKQGCETAANASVDSGSRRMNFDFASRCLCQDAGRLKGMKT
jgi:hypothetical protein